MKTLITTDIYLASALSALGAQLENVNKSDPRHMEFTFSPTRSVVNTGALAPLAQVSGWEIGGLDLEGVERDWANKTLLVNAVEFADAIKRMKSVVHSK